MRHYIIDSFHGQGIFFYYKPFPENELVEHSMDSKFSLEIDEILGLLESSDEDNQLEVKRGSSIGKSILETVCAFSNEPSMGGGLILLGIEESETCDSRRYKVVGVDDPDKLQKDLSTQCANVFNIPIRPTISVERVNQKNLILVRVNELPASQKPLYFSNKGLPSGAYRRVGTTDHRCTEEDLELFYKDGYSLDSEIVNDSSLDDIDQEALELYRTLRKRANPLAEELSYNDSDLLQALNCIKKNDHGEWKLTYTGLIVFGNKMSLRRLMPMVRVDYIRLSGKTWVEDPNRRFVLTLDMRGPIIELVHRIVATIFDDLPKSFSLEEGSLQSKSETALPERVVREAVVNALMHRSYRVHQPIQILRYSNRIEIINAGYSLKPEENIGLPGSVARNPNIATIFHETNLAETKGSGFRTMQTLLRDANMAPPTFESSREKNTFTIRFLLHHFLQEEDIEWLTLFAGYSLRDSQKMGLVFLREVGAIDNMSYRQLTDTSNREASSQLKDLSTKELIKKVGKTKDAYYKPSEDFFRISNAEDTSLGKKESNSITKEANSITRESNSITKEANSITKVANSITKEANSITKEVNSISMGDASNYNDKYLNRRGTGTISGGQPDPNSLLGRRVSNKESMERAILELCAEKPMSLYELAGLLRRTPNYIRTRYLKSMIERGILRYLYPEMVNHPNQKYVATNTVINEIKTEQ